MTDPLELPLALDAMLDLKFAFKVKWIPRWSSASIFMYLKDEELFKQLKRDAAVTGIDQPNFIIDVAANSVRMLESVGETPPLNQTKPLLMVRSLQPILPNLVALHPMGRGCHPTITQTHWSKLLVKGTFLLLR